MAKITNKTKNSGTIQTSNQGSLSWVIKKPFKGAIRFSLYIDNRDTGLSGMSSEDVKESLLQYTKGW